MYNIFLSFCMPVFELGLCFSLIIFHSNLFVKVVSMLLLHAHVIFCLVIELASMHYIFCVE